MRGFTYFAWINFRGKSKDVLKRKILCTKKFRAATNASWPQWIEAMHIIDKAGVQHQILDQKKACKEICDS